MISISNQTKRVEQMEKKRILLVEDDIAYAKHLKKKLRGFGYTLMGVATSVDEVLEKVMNDRPDLVLFDTIQKDKFNDLKAVEQLQNEYHVPVYFTSHINEGTLEQIEASSPFDYLINPEKINDMHYALEMALNQTQREKTQNRLNNLLRYIQNINQLIAKEKNSNKILQGVCDLLIQNKNYDHTWITLTNAFGSNLRVFTAETELGDNFLPINRIIKYNRWPRCGDKALKHSGVWINKSKSKSCYKCNLLKKCKNREALTVRLEYNGKIYGVLSVALPHSVVSESEEQFFISEISENIAFTLHNLAADEEQKIIVKELERVANEWQKTFDAVSDIVILMTLDHEIIRINKTGYNSFGKKPEEIIGKKCYEVIHGKKAPIKGCPCMKTIKSGRSEVGEINQKERYYTVTSDPILDVKNEFVAIAHTIRDITERKRTEEELKKKTGNLERFVKLAVGREKKMIELKQKIKELELALRNDKKRKKRSEK